MCGFRTKIQSSASSEKTAKNLWVTGLSSSIRASQLKAAFSKHGKVISAKIVTVAKSPGSRCFGFVSMLTVEAADLCVKNLNKTELEGMKITVEKTKSDPSKRSSNRAVDRDNRVANRTGNVSDRRGLPGDKSASLARTGDGQKKTERRHRQKNHQL